MSYCLPLICGDPQGSILSLTYSVFRTYDHHFGCVTYHCFVYHVKLYISVIDEVLIYIYIYI